jgi:hypothetical protein
MIQLCPYCGHVLPTALRDGISNCLNCARVFDSCEFNKLLSAGWLVRKQHITDEQVLVRYGFTEAEAVLALAFVLEKQYNHDDYVKALKLLRISQVYEPDEVA